MRASELHAPISNRPIRVSTHLAPSVLPAYALATRRIGEGLGRQAELVVAADYRRCAADRDHVCFVCSIPFLLLNTAGRIRMEAVVAPVLMGRRYAGRPIYFSDVIVRADRPWRTLADLRGRRWAFNEPYSHSGFIVVLYELARRGLPREFLGETIEAGFHDDAMKMVLGGSADWAAIDSQVLEIALRQRPSMRRQLRVVGTLGPSTIQPIVVSTSRLGVNSRKRVVASLIAMHEDPADRAVLRAAGIDRFTPVGEADYDDIRGKLEAVCRSGLLPTWWESRWHELVGDAGNAQAFSTIGLTSPIQRSSVSSS